MWRSLSRACCCRSQHSGGVLSCQRHRGAFAVAHFDPLLQQASDLRQQPNVYCSSCAKKHTGLLHILETLIVLFRADMPWLGCCYEMTAQPGSLLESLSLKVRSFELRVP